MDKTYIGDIVDYLTKIKKLNKEYSVSSLMNISIHNPFLFRGMENSNYKLLPSIFRKTSDKINGRTIDNDKYLAFSKEIDILKNFIQEASPYISNLNSEVHKYVRWLELAQHYGVPTRLLDWTANPLVALYFACESNVEEEAVIWVLQKNNFL